MSIFSSLMQGSAIPLTPKSVDMVLFNHIYEQMHNPDGGMAEIRRVLTDEGVVYLGLGNRLGITELHYAVLFAALSIQPAREAVHRLRWHAWR